MTTKRRVLKVCKVVGLVLAGLFLVAAPVLAQSYIAEIALEETAGTGYTMLPVVVPLDTVNLIAENYLTAMGLDSRVTNGSTYAHMLADDKLLFGFPLPASSSNPLEFSAGNTALSAFDILVGRDGYITVTDAAPLEPGNNFEFEIDGYVDTAAGANKYLIYKQYAFTTYISGATDIRATLWSWFGWASPTGHVAGAWGNPGLAWDDNVGTFAWENVIFGNWSSFLELTHAAIDIESVRYFCGGDHLFIDQIDVDIFHDGGWHDVYQGIFVQGVWETKTLPAFEEDVTAIRIALYNSGVLNHQGRIFEVDYGEVGELSVTATGVASGEHTVEVTADGVDLKIYIDTVEEDSAAMGALTTVDNANNWIINQNNVLPYMASYKQTVGGTLISHYEPNTYIVGTTLPDREGAAQNGTITWGANPTGVSAVMGSLMPTGSYAAEDEPLATPDAAGEVSMPPEMMRQDPGMESAWDILFPFISPTATTTNTPAVLLVWFLSGAIVIGMIVVAHRFFQNMWLTGVAGIVGVGIGIAMGAFPGWFLIVAVLSVIGIVTLERSPSL